MKPGFMWLAEALEVLTFLVIGPAVGIVVAYRGWRGNRHDLGPMRYGMRSIGFGAAGLLLFGFAKWLNADVRTPQYLLQLTCALASALLFGACWGYGVCVLIAAWRWHNATRMK